MTQSRCEFCFRSYNCIKNRYSYQRKNNILEKPKNNEFQSLSKVELIKIHQELIIKNQNTMKELQESQEQRKLMELKESDHDDFVILFKKAIKENKLPENSFLRILIQQQLQALLAPV